MIRLAVIGLGTISSVYTKAARALGSGIDLAAAYDIDAAKQTELSRWESMDTMLAQPWLDGVIVSTPPHTHAEVAKQCIRAGKMVMLEKPAAASMEQLEEVIRLGRQQNSRLYVSLHAAFGVELNWYAQQQKELDAQLRGDQISSIECGFFDPYAENGSFSAQHANMGGSYMDSAVNALSVCARLLPLESYAPVMHHVNKMGDVVCSSRTRFCGEGPEITIETDWTRGLNRKSSLLRFRETEDRILLDHSRQCAELLRVDGSRRILFDGGNGDRLTNQYTGVFEDLASLLAGKEDSWQAHENRIISIHRLLFAAEKTGLDG